MGQRRTPSFSVTVSATAAQLSPPEVAARDIAAGEVLWARGSEDPTVTCRCRQQISHEGPKCLPDCLRLLDALAFPHATDGLRSNEPTVQLGPSARAPSVTAWRCNAAYEAARSARGSGFSMSSWSGSAPSGSSPTRCCSWLPAPVSSMRVPHEHACLCRVRAVVDDPLARQRPKVCFARLRGSFGCPEPPGDRADRRKRRPSSALGPIRRPRTLLTFIKSRNEGTCVARSPCRAGWARRSFRLPSSAHAL